MSGRNSWIRAGVTVAVLAAILGFYGWTVSDREGRLWYPGEKFDYYNLLVDAFRAGRLHLGVDPAANPHLHDASLYQGRYYLYFGIAPVLLLLWPVTLLTGHDVSEPLAAVVFASGALILAVVWLGVLRRRFFPSLSNQLWAAGILALGLGSIVPAMLRRPQFYEVAAGCGYAAVVGLMLALTRAILSPERAGRWLALASSCAGLAAAARPNLVVAAAVVLPAVAGWIWWSQRTAPPRRTRRFVTLTVAAGAPATLGLVALGIYNYARFGSIFEFGANYQIGGNPHGMIFRPEFLWHNFQLYYLIPPRLGWFFPFVAPGPEPPQPENYWGPEDAHGQFVFLPLMIAAAAWGARRWRVTWRSAERRPLVAIILVLLTFWLVNLVITASTGWRANRYMLDFHPWLLVLCILALWDCATVGSCWTRPAVFAAIGWLYLVCGYNGLISFEVHGLLRDVVPERFERLARHAHRGVWPLHRALNPVFGARVFDVVFPPGQPGVIEPLITTALPDEAAALYVRYIEEGQAQLLLEHPPYGLTEGASFETRPGTVRRLEVALGSFLPPVDHPWYAGLPRDQQRQLLTKAVVEIDDQIVFDAQAPLYPTSPNFFEFGRRALSGFGEERFSGQLRNAGLSTLDRTYLARHGGERGAIVLRTLLPRDRPGLSEPLVVIGSRDRFELIRITYVDQQAVRIGHEHAGDGFITESPPIAVDYMAEQEVRVEFGKSSVEMRDPAFRGVRVWLNGWLVLARQFEPHAATPYEVFIGCVPWPVGSIRRMYGGRMIDIQRDERPSADPVAELVEQGQLRLMVMFPRNRIGQSEPLLTSGRSGAGDGVYVRYDDTEHIVIGFDHWGKGGKETAPLLIDYDRPQSVVIAGGFLLDRVDPRGGQLRVWLNEAEVLVLPTGFYRASRDEVWLGRNPIGLSTAMPEFSGAVTVVSSQKGQ
jgi:hypothetical protein